MIPTPDRCCFPGCTDLADHTHHITYNPEIKKPLCRPHHEEITILNGQHARRIRHGLSNKHRWWIWYQWLENKLRVRRTKKALEYIGDWDRKDTLQSESQFVLDDAAERLRIEQAEHSVELHTPKKKRRVRRKKKEASRSQRLRGVRTAKGPEPPKRKKKKKKSQKPSR
jgi:hypothetical protein